jgi:hypothetical protein
MASTSAFDRDETCKRIATLEKRLYKEQSKILPEFHKVIADAHQKYKKVLGKLMKATDGKIFHHLKVHPSLITQLSQKIVDHDIQDHHFSTSFQVAGLFMASMQAVSLAMNDLHEQGEKFLAGAKDPDPVVQAKYTANLKEFKEMQDAINTEFKRRQDEFVALSNRVRYMEGRHADMVKEVLNEDAKVWSKKVSV